MSELEGGPIVGDDGLARCPWESGPGAMREYHDAEWGVPVSGESAYFERLSLEAFQSGLSWATILRKRENFRAAFAGFDVDRIAEFGPPEEERLLADAGIVRNRAKIESTIANARATQDLRADGGLEAFILGFAPAASPRPRVAAEMEAVTAESTALSKALKKRGFRFVGPTTMQALMQAIGLFDPHLMGCHRRGAIPRPAS